jgi:hypothetical protein
MPSLTKSFGFNVFTLLFWGLRAAAQQQGVPLDYRLEFAGNEIHVELKYTPVQPDSTSFTYGMPAFGGQVDILMGLKQLQIAAPDRLRLDSASRTITVYYRQGHPITITYHIVDTRKVNDTRTQLFRPMITPGYVFVHGINLFLLPRSTMDHSTIHASISWKKPPPFPVFYAFDPENNGGRPSVTTMDSISFRFIAGAPDLSIRRFHSESGVNYMVLRSTEIPPDKEKVIEHFYLGYNRQMRAYWRDARVIQYSLVLLPFVGVNEPMHGVSFGNGFIGKYNKPDSLAFGERQFVIAHEIGHYYLGDLSADVGKNEEGQWFDEGFNDYTTLFNLTGAAYITPEQFADDLNQILKKYYTSKIRNMPNEKIFENFWKTGDYDRLPYWRGCTFAFYLDNQIALASGQKYTIRSLMLDLKELVSNRNNKMFTNEEFIQAASKYLPHQQVADAFKRYILDGESITFDNRLLLPELEVGQTDGVPAIRIVRAESFLQHFKFEQ